MKKLIILLTFLHINIILDFLLFLLINIILDFGIVHNIKIFGFRYLRFRFHIFQFLGKILCINWWNRGLIFEGCGSNLDGLFKSFLLWKPRFIGLINLIFRRTWPFQDGLFSLIFSHYIICRNFFWVTPMNFSAIRCWIATAAFVWFCICRTLNNQFQLVALLVGIATQLFSEITDLNLVILPILSHIFIKSIWNNMYLAHF